MTLEHYIVSIIKQYDHLQFASAVEATYKPNLEDENANRIGNHIGLKFIGEKENGSVCFANANEELRDEFKQVFTTADFLDYIYAVVHKMAYRQRQKELLKIDFKKIPCPNDGKTFWKLVKLGSKIRQIHLLERNEAEEYSTSFSVVGDNVVTKLSFVKVSDLDKDNYGNVFINETQYFESVPEIAWDFTIFSHQPAQKWLRDRKGKELSFQDIFWYQKIIHILTDTDRLIKEIDKIGRIIQDVIL